MSTLKKPRVFPKLTSAQTLAVGFALLILMGGLLLSLPISNKNGEFISFLDALFTAGSATCVTGLVVFDTYTQFSMFGQLIILLLIQIGGLGFMSFAMLIPMMMGKKIGLKERAFQMEAINPLQLGGVVRLTKHILVGTLVFETIGAVLLAFRFIPDFGLKTGLWYAVFHSVSAFCNAGFDLLGVRAPYSSVSTYYNDPLVCLTIAFLIIIGGIGFVVWEDVSKHRLHVKKYALHTKIVLVMTASLIVVGTILFYIMEYNVTMKDMSFSERLLCSFFQSVSPRTAGFNSVDTATMAESSRLLTILLMIVGAAPGSTGGGIKVSTFAVIVLAISAQIRERTDVNAFRKRIDTDLVKRAFCSASIYLLMALLGCVIITGLQGLKLEDVLYECFSAIGTVGLSVGITRDLEPFSRFIIIALMYTGRVGSLTVFMAVAEKKTVKHLRNPVEKVIIG